MIGGLVGRLCGWRYALALGAAMLLVAPAMAQPLPDRRLDAVGGGRLNGGDFFTAALIASGVEDACELGGWVDCYAERRNQLLSDIPASSSLDRLRAIHAALHEQILVGKYEAVASDLRLALTHGDFNCLSAVAIYFDLCQAAGLDVEIWLTRGHVYLGAPYEGESVIIEPGSPHWSSRRLARPAVARQLPPVALLGKFYYNRGIGLLRAHQFSAGLELLKISLALDPADSDARANLVAGLNNWAVDHCRANRYHAAAPLIEQGLLLDPFFAPLVANDRLVRARLSD
jgi:hypothetical protein